MAEKSKFTKDQIDALLSWVNDCMTNGTIIIPATSATGTANSIKYKVTVNSSGNITTTKVTT